MPTEKISSPSPFFQAHTKKSPKSQKIDPKDTCLSSQKKKRKENTGKFLPFFFLLFCPWAREIFFYSPD